MGILNDKIIIVTGASSGIGEATAREAAKEGATVVLADINEKDGNRVAEEIKKEGSTAIFVKTDVSVEQDVKNLVEKTVQEFGRLDGALNNAGTSIPGMVDNLNMEDVERITRVNYFSILYCMKYEIAQIKKQGTGGSIVNNSSLAGIVALPGFSGYTGSKHAVIGVTRSAALENALLNIRVNVILPGPVDTNFWNLYDNGAELLAGFNLYAAMKRAAKPIEIAQPVCFLLSDKSSFMTGSEIVIDGGFDAGMVTVT